MTKTNRNSKNSFLIGRPEREKIIQKDEITNLTIKLNTSLDVNDFLKSLENNKNN